MKLTRTFSTILLVIAINGCAMRSEMQSPPTPRVTVSPHFSPAVYDRVAVYTIDSKSRRIKTGKEREIEDEFMRAVMEKGYTLAARSDINQIKKELAIQSSNYTEIALARAAKAINVSAIIIISINDVVATRYTPVVRINNMKYYNAEANISARMISAELGQVVWISSFTRIDSINNPADKYRTLPYVARVVASGLPNKN